MSRVRIASVFDHEGAGSISRPRGLRDINDSNQVDVRTKLLWNQLAIEASRPWRKFTETMGSPNQGEMPRGYVHPSV